jgi:hypothetical protein
MTDQDRPTQLTVVAGDRASLERELLWNVALDGDIVRREQICRMLARAANTELAVAPTIEQGEEQSRD